MCSLKFLHNLHQGSEKYKSRVRNIAWCDFSLCLQLSSFEGSAVSLSQGAVSSCKATIQPAEVHDHVWLGGF